MHPAFLIACIRACPGPVLGTVYVYKTTDGKPLCNCGRAGAYYIASGKFAKCHRDTEKSTGSRYAYTRCIVLNREFYKYLANPSIHGAMYV